MRKLIAIVEKLLAEGKFYQGVIELQNSEHTVISEPLYSGNEFHLNLIEGLEEARRGIDSVEAMLAAALKANTIDPRPNWNLTLWCLLEDRKSFTYVPSDIGNIGLHVKKDLPEEQYLAGTFKVKFTPLNGENLNPKTIWVNVPTVIWNDASLNRLVVTGAICKALCEQFGNIDVYSIEAK